MNKKIPLGAAVAFMAIIAAITFAITMVYSGTHFEGILNQLREREAMYSKQAEIDRYVRENYYGVIDEETLTDSLAGGYISGIGDPAAKYFSADEYSKMNQVQTGRAAGIGIVTTMDQDGYMLVTDVYPDSPAHQVLAPGDIIVQIDDIGINTETYYQCSEAIYGDAGTKVSLVIRRENEDTKIELTRRQIDPLTISFHRDGRVGYIRIHEFGDSTPEQFDRELNGLIAAGVQALIIDVRNNDSSSAVSVKAAARILDRLLPEGDILSRVVKNGRVELLYTSDPTETQLSLVVLHNERSGGAAEIFAIALKDYKKCYTVGQRTMGKGSIQTTYKLLDGSAVEITTAKYKSPEGTLFDGVGIRPDYEVRMSPDMIFEEVSYSEYDVQYKRAVELAEALIRVNEANQQNSRQTTDTP